MIDSFLSILGDILPLYFIAFIGFITGKCFNIDSKTVATITVFVISPIVFCLSISKLTFSPEVILAPILYFSMAVVFGFLFLKIAKFYLPEKTAYLTALTIGTNNWGYFGIPIAFALFSPEIVALYILTGVCFQIYESSFGMYFISRGNFSPIESLKNVFRYPVIYAIFLGLILSIIKFDLPDYGQNFLDLFKGAYTVLGMMIIGLGLASIKTLTFDFKFIFTVFFIRFVFWPAITLSVIALDQHFNFLGSIFYKPLLLFSIVPMAANNIAFADKFDMNPGKASIAVVLTTLFALIYIPVAIKLLGLS